jgi:hypothetical protein
MEKLVDAVNEQSLHGLADELLLERKITLESRIGLVSDRYSEHGERLTCALVQP